jgi:hypothetical protein
MSSLVAHKDMSSRRIRSGTRSLLLLPCPAAGVARGALARSLPPQPTEHIFKTPTEHIFKTPIAPLAQQQIRSSFDKIRSGFKP